MTSQYIRALDLIVGLATVLGMASISAGQPSDEQVSRQIERQLSKNQAFRGVTIRVQEHVAFLNGAVPTLQAREQAIDEARTVQGVQGVISHLIIPSAENDSVLAPKVSKAIVRYPYFTLFDYVEGTIDNGVVRLTGYVLPTPDKKKAIVQRVSGVPGVQAIQDDIQVLSPSSEDHRLRRAIARRIFRSPHFQRFVTMPNPPFHIIVHRSVVTLVGVVQSEIDRREMERITRQTQGVLRVDSGLETPTGG